MINTQTLGEALKKSKGCGTRFGCSICVVVPEDASMTNMLKLPQYAYMKGLAKLRNFLIATQYDLSRRDWIGKTIDKDGYIRIKPDTYSPRMLEDILKYAISVDYEEYMNSRAENLRPRFTLVSPQQLVAIDALWSLNGIHRPFHALKIYEGIWCQDNPVEIPELMPAQKVPFPPAKYYHVGTQWCDNEHAQMGLRDPIWETFGSGGCEVELATLSNGKSVLNVGTEAPFTINNDELGIFLDLEAPRLVEEYHDDPHHGFNAGYFYYLRAGILEVNKSQRSRVDMILRRTAYKEQLGLNGAPDPAPILAKSVDREPPQPAIHDGSIAEDTATQDWLPFLEQAA